MTALIDPESMTAKAGLKIANSQGLYGEDAILFANALTEEYMSFSWTPDDAIDMLESMLDVELKPSSSQDKDDFIVGKVVTNHADGYEVTRIVSYEKLPKQFSGAEVEIRLKKIEKPPFKKVYEGIGRVVRQNDDSPPFVAVDSGKLSSRGRTDYIIFSEAERELLGKNIRVTIEEVQ
jgi:hypothetical protein